MTKELTQQQIGKKLDKEMGQRDAVHVAVLPASAGTVFKPGEHVGYMSGYATVINCVGVVDPFLKEDVQPGERFYIFLYPNTITSLCHLWEHPTIDAKTDVEVSKEWIEKFAEEINQTYRSLMSAAENWVDGRDYTYDNSESYKDSYEKFPEFWKHYAVVTGTTPDVSPDDSFFTCSC